MDDDRTIDADDTAVDVSPARRFRETNEFEVETDLALTLVEGKSDGSRRAAVTENGRTRIIDLIGGRQRRGQRSTTGAGGCSPDDARTARTRAGTTMGKNLRDLFMMAP